MGYSTRDGGIRTFWPDNTETELFIMADWISIDWEDLQGQIFTHFGIASMEGISFGVDYIHTDCLGYDQYDSSDYTKFL